MIALIEVSLYVGGLALALWIISKALTGSHLFKRISTPRISLVDELQKVEQEIAAEHLRHELVLKRKQLEKERAE